MTWGTLWEDAFPLGSIMLMLAADCLLYCALAWYCDKVLPPALAAPPPAPVSWRMAATTGSPAAVGGRRVWSPARCDSM